MSTLRRKIRVRPSKGRKLIAPLWWIMKLLREERRAAVNGEASR